MDDSISLDRIAIRTRETQVTRSAWKLAVLGSKGPGAILRVESGGADAIFRGEGSFLGWSQERLAAEYQRLLPKGGDPEPDPGQFG